jgi:DNA-binding winged helix-turn-helix (wHTH) protein
MALNGFRINFDGFEINPHTGEVFKETRRIPLQDQPARLLALLASRPGELVTRAEIQQALWKGGEFVEFEHAVNTAVRKIRLALNDDPETPRIIETLRGKGYRFIAPVETKETDTKTPAPLVEPPAPVDPSGGSSNRGPFRLPISPSRSRQLFLLTQAPYVVTYLVAFHHWDAGMEMALGRIFSFVSTRFTLPLFQTVALVGFAIRVYLIGLVGWGHHDAGTRFRKIFPLIAALDGVWAATPILVERAVTPLVSWAGLVLMSWLIFGQRTLMRNIEAGS